MAQLKLFLLGSPRIEINGSTIKTDTRKALALLVFLSVSGDTQSRDWLVNLLWPDFPQNRARAALRQCLYLGFGYGEKAISVHPDKMVHLS